MISNSNTPRKLGPEEKAKENGCTHDCLLSCTMFVKYPKQALWMKAWFNKALKHIINFYQVFKCLNRGLREVDTVSLVYTWLTKNCQQKDAFDQYLIRPQKIQTFKSFWVIMKIFYYVNGRWNNWMWTNKTIKSRQLPFYINS